MGNLTRWIANKRELSVVVAPKDGQPFPIDAFVFEEDTHLALSAQPMIHLPMEHPVRTLTEAHQASPKDPGCLVVKTGLPIRMLAIVHKLDEDPTWQEEWVAAALDRVLLEVERRRLRSIALPLLGAVHGKLKVERFLALLKQALEEGVPPTLDRLWLIVPEGSDDEIHALVSELV